MEDQTAANPSITVDETMNRSGETDELYPAFKKSIMEAIQSGRGIRLKSFTVSSDVEMKMDSIIHHILQAFGHLEMKPLVYTVVKELLINATKANLKRIFFLEKGLDIRDEEDYKRGALLYREALVEDVALSHGVRAREMNHSVVTDFRFRDEGLRIQMINTAEMAPQEEERLRRKLEKAMQYDSMLDFYMDNADDTEGAGLGLAMIVTMLKSEGIDPSYFRLFTKDEKTIARVEIPFNDNYKSVREQFLVVQEEG